MCKHVWHHTHAEPTEIRRGCRSPGTVDTDSSEPPCRFWNQTWVLWKKSQCLYPLTHVSRSFCYCLFCNTIKYSSSQPGVPLSSGSSYFSLPLQSRDYKNGPPHPEHAVLGVGSRDSCQKSNPWSEPHPKLEKLLWIQIRCNKNLSHACRCSDSKDIY